MEVLTISFQRCGNWGTGVQWQAQVYSAAKWQSQVKLRVAAGSMVHTCASANTVVLKRPLSAVEFMENILNTSAILSPRSSLCSPSWETWFTFYSPGDSIGVCQAPGVHTPSLWCFHRCVSTYLITIFPKCVVIDSKKIHWVTVWLKEGTGGRCLKQHKLLCYSSGIQKSKWVSLTNQDVSRVAFSGGFSPGEDWLPCLLLILESVLIPWLQVPPSIFIAGSCREAEPASVVTASFYYTLCLPTPTFKFLVKYT
jgi:hypothetical protein